MELILELVRIGVLSKKEAALIAGDIHKSNPRHISRKVLDGFMAKLKLI